MKPMPADMVDFIVSSEVDKEFSQMWHLATKECLRHYGGRSADRIWVDEYSNIVCDDFVSKEAATYDAKVMHPLEGTW